jgi:uncharacterized membrane protein
MVAASFFIVAVPIGLEAKWITIGWLVEATVLLWISGRSETRFMKYFGAATMAFGLIRLVFIEQFDPSRLIFNERMLSYTVAIAALVFAARTFVQWEEDKPALPILIVTINVLALLALTPEITDAWRREIRLADSDAVRTLRIVRDFAYSILWMAYGAGLMFVGFWKSSRFLRWQALVLIAITTSKVFLYDTSSLDRGYRILCLIGLGLLLLATSFFYQRDWFKLKER